MPENRSGSVFGMDSVIQVFHEFPLVVEVRHTLWNQPQIFDGLKRDNVAVCNIDQPVLDDCFAPIAIATGNFG